MESESVNACNHLQIACKLQVVTGTGDSEKCAPTVEVASAAGGCFLGRSRL
jgi:hypothetical protein